MKTLRGNNKNIHNIAKVSNNELVKNSKKNNYLDIISHNISESRQTLKNPQEFYMGLFSNIVQKTINDRKRYNKSRKELTSKKIEEFNKNKITNHRNLSDNDNDQKIKRNSLQKDEQLLVV